MRFKLFGLSWDLAIPLIIAFPTIQLSLLGAMFALDEMPWWAILIWIVALISSIAANKSFWQWAETRLDDSPFPTNEPPTDTGWYEIQHVASGRCEYVEVSVFGGELIALIGDHICSLDQLTDYQWSPKLESFFDES